MFGRVFINIIRLGKIWEIQLVILAYPAFRGQEFKGKKLCESRSVIDRNFFIYIFCLFFCEQFKEEHI